jgi:CubicO group peptidase (beta-lactamase class C family)
MTYTIHGRYESNFEPLADVFLQQLPKSPRKGGQALTVYHRGIPVVDIWSGVRDKAGAPWLADTMSISYSTTKGVLSTLAHMLVDEGVLAYDTPIARWWPEFAANGKHGITLRHVMTHESGLYHIRQMIQNAREMLDWPHMLEVIAAAKPYHAPGERVGYHALTYGWIVGGLIEKATGRPLAALLDEKLVQPLELDGCYIGVPDSELPRCAEIIGAARYNPNPKPPSKIAVWRQKLISNALALTGFDDTTSADALIPRGMSRFYLDEPESLQACIPGANGVFTARSLARIYAALANGGELDGVRLLSAQRLAEATRVHSRQRGDVVPMAMNWRLGYHRIFTTWPKTPHAFGHFGYGGSGAWADPSRDLAVAYTVNTGSGSPMGDLRIMRINTAVIQCVES